MSKKEWVSFFCLCALLLNPSSAGSYDKKLSYTLRHYIIAGVYERLGENELAIEEYKKALNIDYKNIVLHVALAVTYLKANNVPKAFDELKIASKIDPEAAEPHAILALLYFSQNKTALAQAEYELALRSASLLEPKNIDIYKSLGALYLQEKKFKEAQNTYRLVLDLAPQDSEAHFYLANTYDELKNRSKAVEELKKALQFQPDYPEALNYLGYIYVEENIRLDEAQALIQKALLFEPDNGAYIDSLGWLYFKQGKLQEAIISLEKAASLLQDPVIYDHLGDAYFESADLEKARMSWEKSIALDPSQEKVKQKLENSRKEKVTLDTHVNNTSR